jgi:hypothetical protein
MQGDTCIERWNVENNLKNALQYGERLRSQSGRKEGEGLRRISITHLGIPCDLLTPQT